MFPTLGVQAGFKTGVLWHGYPFDFCMNVGQFSQPGSLRVSSVRPARP